MSGSLRAQARFHEIAIGHYERLGPPKNTMTRQQIRRVLVIERRRAAKADARNAIAQTLREIRHAR